MNIVNLRVWLRDWLNKPSKEERAACEAARHEYFLEWEADANERAKRIRQFLSDKKQATPKTDELSSQAT